MVDVCGKGGLSYNCINSAKKLHIDRAIILAIYQANIFRYIAHGATNPDLCFQNYIHI